MIFFEEQKKVAKFCVSSVNSTNFANFGETLDSPIFQYHKIEGEKIVPMMHVEQ
jgi:hypothetical protein